MIVSAITMTAHQYLLLGEDPPDLCVEVIDSTSDQIDRKDKVALYAAGKVKHYWIVDPKQRTIEAIG